MRLPPSDLLLGEDEGGNSMGLILEARNHTVFFFTTEPVPWIFSFFESCFIVRTGGKGGEI